MGIKKYVNQYAGKCRNYVNQYQTRRKDKKGELIISDALDTDEGRKALAKAMKDDYQAVGRKVLMADKLPSKEEFNALTRAFSN